MLQNKHTNCATVGRMGDFYINRHGVQLTWLSDELIAVVARLQETVYPDIEFEYSFIGMIHTDFARAFTIDMDNPEKAGRQMDAIDQQHMEALYRVGLADMACSIYIDDRCYSLYFRIEGRKMKAYDDTNNVLVNVPAVLEAPDAFIQFTRDHFLRSAGH